MKKTILIAAALPLAALAEPRDIYKMSEDEIKAIDKVEWSGKGSLAGEDMKEYSQLKAAAASLDKAMEKAISDKIFVDASKESTMQALLDVVQKPLVTNKKRVNSPPGSFSVGDKASQGLKALDSLTVMLDSIDRQSRSATMELIDFANVMQLPRRYAKISQVVERINAWQHTKTLADFDDKYGRFRKLLAAGDAEILKSTSGPDLLRMSGLGRYANDSCQKEPFFDRDLRTIDSYLATLSETALGAFKEYVELFESRWNRTLATVRKDNAYFREHALSLSPTDRKAVDALYYGFGTILEDAQAYIAAAKALIAKVEEPGSEICRLRRCEGFNTSGWIDCAGSVQSNGCPGYSRRGRRALEDIKDAFKKRRRDLDLVKCTWE